MVIRTATVVEGNVHFSVHLLYASIVGCAAWALTSFRRAQRYHEVRRLHQEAKPIREIAKELGLSRGAVRRYPRADRCPDWQRRPALAPNRRAAS